VEGAHDVVVSVDEELGVALHGDLGTAVLGEEHGLANLDVGGAELSVIEDLAGSNGNNHAVVELIGLARGEDDASLGLGLGGGLLDHDTVEEGLEGLEREHIFNYKF
jgi:hypothetical protein